MQETFQICLYLFNIDFFQDLQLQTRLSQHFRFPHSPHMCYVKVICYETEKLLYAYNYKIIKNYI